FRFEQLGAGGQRITLEFRLGMNSAEPQILKPQMEELLDRNFSCRLTKDTDRDIVEVIRCIYYSYGYEYVHQEIYHAGEFKKMLHGGKYLSLLAENEHGQVVGHTALSEHDWFAGMSELCNLVVVPNARGNNIARLLMQASLDLCEQEKLNALYGMPVMFHPISQKLLDSHDFTPCGMCFHLCPASASKQFGDGTNRFDVAFTVRIRERQATHTLYLPDETSSFVCDIFDREQVPYTVVDASRVEPAADKSIMSYAVDGVSKKLEIKVDQMGRDLPERLKSLPFEKDIDSMEMLMVYLNMNDPGCGVCYAALRELGFIFTGCLPGSKDGDYLLLQHLMGKEIVRENMVTTPAYASMLERLYAINGMA
ncbi:MAG: GNAT family N-acetyltransferase, partial [Coriobacteriales bacterium]|nr:GNAT family N-acetyltransferase [Coriobacteriales bacterium]